MWQHFDSECFIVITIIKQIYEETQRPTTILAHLPKLKYFMYS